MAVVVTARVEAVRGVEVRGRVVVVMVEVVRARVGALRSDGGGRGWGDGGFEKLPHLPVSADHRFPPVGLAEKIAASRAHGSSAARIIRAMVDMEDGPDDADCKATVAAVDAAARELTTVLSATMLSAKAALAEAAREREAELQAAAAADVARLEALLGEERGARQQAEARLEKAFAVQQRLADRLHSTREQAANRLQALRVMGEWQRSLDALKREQFVERAAPRHCARVLMRKVLGGWRSASRTLRQCDAPERVPHHPLGADAPLMYACCRAC
jgi:hypothetical protein